MRRLTDISRAFALLLALDLSLAATACGGAQSKDEIGAPNEQLEAQVTANLDEMTNLELVVSCPAIDPKTVEVQCTATPPTGEKIPVDLEKREDGFHITAIGAVFEERLQKAATIMLTQFGIEASEVACPTLAMQGTKPRCTATADGVELRVMIDYGDQIGAVVESGLIDVSAVEKHIVETTALPGGVESADCGKRYVVAKPGSMFDCLAKGPENEITVHVRVEDGTGRVTVSITPFEE